MPSLRIRFEQGGLLIRWLERMAFAGFGEDLVDEGEVFLGQALLVRRRRRDIPMALVEHPGPCEEGMRVLLG